MRKKGGDDGHGILSLHSSCRVYGFLRFCLIDNENQERVVELRRIII